MQGIFRDPLVARAFETLRVHYASPEELVAFLRELYSTDIEGEGSRTVELVDDGSALDSRVLPEHVQARANGYALSGTSIIVRV